MKIVDSQAPINQEEKSMDVSDIAEWTLDGVLDDLSRIHSSMRDRQFAFILGAGASVSSGIPTGQQLAERWLKDLHLRECLDGRSMDEWLRTSGLGDVNLKLDNAAEYYPQIFERRFEGDSEAGYAELEVAMDGKSPSLGYSLLAEIIQHTRHKVVVTTNFDNLVADALAMHAHRSPLVIAHESLAGFVRPHMRRPLVAKIHRDLYLNPFNDTTTVSTIELGWKVALKKLFQFFTPIVVGYGGNDGSLMNLLLDLDPGDIAGRIVWCYRTGSKPPEKALNVLKKHKGILVEVSGFDHFMLRLAAKLVTDFDVAAIAERTAQLGEIRAARYREQATLLYESSLEGSSADQKTSEVLLDSVKTNGSWWAWQIKAIAEPDMDRRHDIYREGLRNLPNSSELLASYGVFLEIFILDYDAAEKAYKHAIELEPDDPSNLDKYASFLASCRGDVEGAKTLYEKGLRLASSDAMFNAGYARFLDSHLENTDAASDYFIRAIKLEPENFWCNCSYAQFLESRLKDMDAAEKYYRLALKYNSESVWVIYNFALFLSKRRMKHDEAEALFQKAFLIDPHDKWLTQRYEQFQSIVAETTEANQDKTQPS
ncbi:hypothetical protein [Pseudomonas syringae]|uniref:hypothetical protein n=1 Tax=Pseudomonas syringae TaxID=317 RepID=UPI001BCE6050|nr:hypothetical protein [Pseudomonas syringae]MBS7416341.1 hypothetical protein [Pseudomonas syringae]